MSEDAWVPPARCSQVRESVGFEPLPPISDECYPPDAKPIEPFDKEEEPV